MAQIKEFLSSEEWDAPFFKRLAHNDTGRASGHQAGIVVPKDLRRFFPTLDQELISTTNPTIDRPLRAEMYVGISQVGDAIVRYQFQTWGGTRPPEGRITDNLRPIRAQARAHDVLVFQRAAEALDRFRLILIKARSADFSAVRKSIGERRWGVLFADEEPVTQVELDKASQELDALAKQPFALKRGEVKRVETRQSRIARSSAFPQLVRKQYRFRCSVSGFQIATPTGLYEVQAAHVVPVSEGGTDDVRNGLALSQTLHWAFDRGLFGITPDRRVYIPSGVREMAINRLLRQFKGKPIAEANAQRFRVHEDALAWHLECRVGQWE